MGMGAVCELWFPLAFGEDGMKIVPKSDWNSFRRQLLKGVYWLDLMQFRAFLGLKEAKGLIDKSMSLKMFNLIFDGFCLWL